MYLTEWARWPGAHQQAANRWFREGTLPVPAVRVSSRSVPVAPDAVAAGGGLGPCARVSPHEQGTGLDGQVAQLTARASRAGQPVARVEAEAGPGMSGSRPRARRLLAGPRAGVAVAVHRGRPGRMTTGPAGAAPPAHGRRLVVPGPAEVQGDLLRDMAEVLASFCARLYGRRCARSRAEKALRCAGCDAGPGSREVAG
jgi:putative resolvase